MKSLNSIEDLQHALKNIDDFSEVEKIYIYR